ncbi:hypothetical protein Hypma_001640 [Hypsizygus marmoreus]|uniref:Uncharacterized protein n=1 Tax=Hypsizygus marmoreus TaxID=39966 RepID=A0A369JAI7_HYPMA|nr:hypothetical protein Hypma_001640 [Hypsizygus marmoreus]
MSNLYYSANISPEHQKNHWPIHKQSCYARTHRGPLSPTDIAIQHLLQFHDTAIVEIAVSALIKEDINVDFATELERKAVVFTVEQRPEKEDMDVAVAAGRLPPYRIARDISVVLIEAEAKQRGLDRPYLEHPWHQQMRLARKQLGVAMIFLPGGRAVTKRVPSIQLSMWDMMKNKEKTTTNPPILYWHLNITNGQINTEIEQEAKAQAREGGIDVGSS